MSSGCTRGFEAREESDEFGFGRGFEVGEFGVGRETGDEFGGEDVEVGEETLQDFEGGGVLGEREKERRGRSAFAVNQGRNRAER